MDRVLEQNSSEWEQNPLPPWIRLRSKMKSYLPPYYNSSSDQFAEQVSSAIRQLNGLRPAKNGPGYLGVTSTQPDFRSVTNAELADETMPLEDVVADSVQMFDGSLNFAHPSFMSNVCPTPNKAAVIAAMMANIYNPNMIEGEYSWNVVRAEMESAAILSKLIGWSPTEAGGFYTFGGTGCYLYGIKYALTQVLGLMSRYDGVRTDGKLLVSEQAHYAKMTCADWTGLGIDNIVEVKTDSSNAMDVEDLEAKMKYFQSQGIPIVAVVCTAGTTDAFAVDPIDKARELISKYPNRKPYGPTILYCDAVIGWSFLTFGKYNFSENPLGFSDTVLHEIQRNYNLIRMVKHADAIGIDFHKTGWAPYSCSLFMMKNFSKFRSLMSRPTVSYIQYRTPYNPGLYTLETSRSASNVMAGWATLKYFGYQGFQCVLGGILHIQDYLRKRIENEESMVCVNTDCKGFVTLFRVYPEGINASEQYEKELSDEVCKEDLIKHNKLQAQIADILWYWFRLGIKVDDLHVPYTSYSAGFRTANYHDGNGHKDSMVYALKSFPMNVNITEKTMDDLIAVAKIARKHADAGFLPYVKKLAEPPYVPHTAPFVEQNLEIDCSGGLPNSKPQVQLQNNRRTGFGALLSSTILRTTSKKLRVHS